MCANVTMSQCLFLAPCDEKHMHVFLAGKCWIGAGRERQNATAAEVHPSVPFDPGFANPVCAGKPSTLLLLIAIVYVARWLILPVVICLMCMLLRTTMHRHCTPS